MRKKITVALTGAFFMTLSAFLWPSSRGLTVSRVTFSPTRAQSSATREASQTRRVEGQVLTSTALPEIRIRFDEALQYAGNKSFTLNGIAQAEQYFFVEADEQRRIKRMFIVQFEGFLPGNTHTYNYPATNLTRLGAHDYVTKSAIVPNVSATLKQNPDTDAAQAAAFMESKGYRYSEDVMFQRFIRVVDEAKRHEFILIYIEDLRRTGLTAADFAKGGRAAEQRDQILQELQTRALKSLEALK